MGWYGFGHKTTVATLRDEVLSDIDAGKICTVIGKRQTAYGKRLWLALEHRATGQKFIMLYLLNPSNGMIKDIDESMGPCYYDCPTSLFELAPTQDKNSLDWRQTCIKHGVKAIDKSASA